MCRGARVYADGTSAHAGRAYTPPEVSCEILHRVRKSGVRKCSPCSCDYFENGVGTIYQTRALRVLRDFRHGRLLCRRRFISSLLAMSGLRTQQACIAIMSMNAKLVWALLSLSLPLWETLPDPCSA